MVSFQYQFVTGVQQLRVLKEGGTHLPSVHPLLSVPPKDGASVTGGPQPPLSGNSGEYQLLEDEKDTAGALCARGAFFI